MCMDPAIQTALFELRILRKMTRQDLDRDRAIESRIARTIHFAHAASAQRRLDFVRAEFRAGG
jgi:hypothetical protein